MILEVFVRKSSRIVLFSLAAFVFGFGTTAYSQSERLEFNRDIRPLFSNVCFKCHGPDADARKADLRLDLEESAFEEREGGRAIVPGDPAASLVVQLITHSDPKHSMPPPDEPLWLSRQDIDKIIRWIEEGAEYEQHWAYTPVTRPPLPEVKQTDWIQNPIDRFVLSQMEAAGLQPCPEADRVTLARRMFVDLTGLPAEPEDVQALKHEGYESIVDRLLASPHYGERMAVSWLDLVRYADTTGYHSDETRNMSPYRDYVINAFNDNKPFDTFTTEQLAGDLIDNATEESLIASGYNRLNQVTAEGGAQAKEYLAMYAADRVRTTGSVWLGATMLCAQCHDHKYDPISTKDFYSFAAFFADIKEKGVYKGRGREKWGEHIVLATEDELTHEGELRDEILELNKGLELSDEALTEERNAWIARKRAELAVDDFQGWEPVLPAAVRSEHGSTLELLPDLSVLSTGETPDQDTYTVEFETNLTGITGLRLEALSHDSFPTGLTRGKFFFEIGELEVFLGNQDEGGLDSVELSRASNAKGATVKDANGAIDGDLTTGWWVRAGEQGAEKEVIAVEFAKPLEGGPGTHLTVRVREEKAAGWLIGRFRLSLTTQPDVSPDREIGISEIALRALKKERETWTDTEVAQLKAYYRLASPKLNVLRESLAVKNAELRAHMRAYASTLISKPVPPRTMRILPRGNWMDESGEVVLPAVPEFLGATKHRGERATREDLAAWLVSRENPLTARVFVNRLWKEYFGAGLSRVLEDMGAQGEPPTHPKLLDWLAVEFMESGWDVKHLVRLITTSATYRQSSTASEPLRELDPFNRLLARQTPVRYGAEAIRDTALVVSGLLVPDIGGRSVRPYQPAGYYAHLNYPKRTYEAETDKQLYRRSVYTHWQRTFLHPSMLAFDAPSREECTADRPKSNTPQQALVLLNDPIYAEAARVFAARILREDLSDAEQRINWAMNQALCRKPNSRELTLLKKILNKHRKQFGADTEAAKATLQVGNSPVPDDIDPTELAAWTSVARVLLNLAELIIRD